MSFVSSHMRGISEERRALAAAHGGAGAAPDISVNVINQTSGQVGAQSQLRPDGNGGFSMDLIISQVEQGMVQRARAGRSRFMRYQEQAYGLNRAAMLARGRR